MFRNTSRILEAQGYLQSTTPSSSMIDRSARRNNGTFSNVSWVKLGTNVWVMNFNGSDSYIEIADSKSMRLTNGGTICMWIYAKTAGESNLGFLFHKGTAVGGTNGYVAYMSENDINFIVNGGTGTITNSDVIPFLTWKFVSITFNSTGRKIYVNSIDVTSSGGSETGLPPNVAGIVRIGNSSVITNRTWDGYIALPKMYSRALSQSEIARIYNAERRFFGL